MDNLADQDEQALELGTGGASFGAIVRRLEFRGAPDAVARRFEALGRATR